MKRADIERRLEDIGLVLPQANTAFGAYLPYLVSGSYLMVSGQGPVLAAGGSITGRLGDGLEIEDGSRAAQLAALNIIAQMDAALNGDFSRVRQFVKLTGYVNSTPDFTHQPAVINGASELLVTLFGDVGRHARAAVGVAALPMGWAVEIDAMIEITPASDETQA
jgi:enamine deaminase RidA (YjgF/YER057c/UK114 family)